LEHYAASIFSAEKQAKQETSMKQSSTYWLMYVGFLLGSLFNPENGTSTFETLVDFRQATRCYTPDKRTPQNLFFFFQCRLNSIGTFYL
jgi:hypothetical protein